MAHAEVTIKETCQHGGKEGKIMHTQDFSGNPWYWVVIPEIHPSVGYWYRDHCLVIKNGNLPNPDKTKLYRHKIEKAGNVAYFKIDRATKDVLIAEGYSVTFDPDAQDKLKKI